MEQFPTSESERRAKARANRAMFDGIAPRYDLLNGLMSLGMDRGWRRLLVARCAVTAEARCLDLCCGTGAVAWEMARRGAHAIGLDASARMLAVARERVGERVMLVQGDALRLPFPNATFDAVTIAFGNRNVASLTGLYAEMRRVARPGGHVASLEISPPVHSGLHRLFFGYFSLLPALLAQLLGTNPAAYRYLPDSVRQYPAPDAVAEIMRGAGLREVAYTTHLGGIVAIHAGVV